MTSLFQVIAHEDANDQGKLRQATALATQRVEDCFSKFVRTGSVDEQAGRFILVEDDVRAVVAAACEQVGYSDAGFIYASIAKNFVTGDATPQLRTAGVRHEARKPKMCPYHSEVTDISLAQGEAQAGFNAMAQHAWGEKHCQGEGYKGDKCKFKPAMTTQAFWDTKAERAEQKRQERAEREEQQRVEQERVNELPEVETPMEEIDAAPTVDAVQVEEIHEHSEPSAIGEGVEEAAPMLMAAKVAQVSPGVFEVQLSGKGGYTSTHTVQATDEYEARQRAIQQNVAQGGQAAWAQRVADAGPVPKMDKNKWKPTRTPVDTEDDDSRWPTRRKDVTAPIKQEQGSREDPSGLKEIGEDVTERQDVTEKGGPAKTDQGGTFGGGERSAVSGLLDSEGIREAMAKFQRG